MCLCRGILSQWGKRKGKKQTKTTTHTHLSFLPLYDRIMRQIAHKLMFCHWLDPRDTPSRHASFSPMKVVRLTERPECREKGSQRRQGRAAVVGFLGQYVCPFPCAWCPGHFALLRKDIPSLWSIKINCEGLVCFTTRKASFFSLPFV